MSTTSTQIPTFVPEPDELLESLGRGGEDVWARLKALRFDGAALLSRFIPGTGLREVNAWRKKPDAIDAATLEVLDALEHTLEMQRRGWNPVEGATLTAEVGFLGHAQCTLKVIGENVRLSKIKAQGRLETWSISNWTCIFMRQQLEDQQPGSKHPKRRRCWVILPGETSITVGNDIEKGRRGCGLLSGDFQVLEFYEDWWEVHERFNMTPSEVAVLPDQRYFSS